MTTLDEVSEGIFWFAMALAYIDAESLRLMLENGVDANKRSGGDDGATLLIMAGYGGADPEVFRALLRHGANVADAEENGRTALHTTLRNENTTPQVIRLLLEHGADVATKAEDGGTPLHEAADHPDPEVVKVLLEYGADIGSTNHEG